VSYQGFSTLPSLRGFLRQAEQVDDGHSKPKERGVVETRLPGSPGSCASPWTATHSIGYPFCADLRWFRLSERHRPRGSGADRQTAGIIGARLARRKLLAPLAPLAPQPPATFETARQGDHPFFFFSCVCVCVCVALGGLYQDYTAVLRSNLSLVLYVWLAFRE
jgi:hypothetical protein